MSKKDFPEEVTQDNISNLREKAKRIRERFFQRTYLSLALSLFVIPSLLMGLGSYRFMFWLLQNHYLDFLLGVTPALRLIVFFVLLFLSVAAWTPLMVLLLLSSFWLVRKLGYPEHEEIIFAECFLIAEHLTNNERLEATEEVGVLLAILKGFVRDIFNPKRKVYRPEFDILRSGKNEICRMLMFSRKKIPDYLMKFGLAFVREDNPKAFFHLKQLLKETRKYGEPKGRFRKFLSALEHYPHSLPWILTIIITIFALIYYFISGQRLPIG